MGPPDTEPSGFTASILNTQRTLNKLGRHAEEASHKQPKCGTWAADGYRHSYATNVANADGARYRG